MCTTQPKSRQNKSGMSATGGRWALVPLQSATVGQCFYFILKKNSGYWEQNCLVKIKHIPFRNLDAVILFLIMKSSADYLLSLPFIIFMDWLISDYCCKSASILGQLHFPFFHLLSSSLWMWKHRLYCQLFPVSAIDELLMSSFRMKCHGALVLH